MPTPGLLRRAVRLRLQLVRSPTIVKFVYVLATIAIGLSVLVFVVAGFASHTPAAGLVVLFLAPIVGLIYLAFIRMGLEFCYALVRMSDDIHSRR
jgi:hypothetical protein